jgi:hypothetical protein
LFENTLIIWTTDHGHLFGDHDLQGKPGAELGKLYEATTRIPLLVHHPDGLGAGRRIGGIVQPADILPSILEFLEVPVPSDIEGKSIWPLVTGTTDRIHRYAFSSRFPPTAGDPTYTPVEGSVFDGWVGSGRIVEPSTVTDDRWAYICAVAGMPSELYDIQEDPDQLHDVINDHEGVADRMRSIWLDFLENHGAGEARVRPFQDPISEVNTPAGGELYGFRDDQGRWITYPSEIEALRMAYREDAPGPHRSVQKLTFAQLLDDNPRNLIHMYGQYYWAEDLT